MTGHTKRDDSDAGRAANFERWAVPLALGYLVGLALLLFFIHASIAPVSRGLLTDIFSFYSVPAFAFAAVYCLLIARELRFTLSCRRGWVLVAAGCLCLAIADTLWAFCEILFRERMRHPSPADVFYLALYPFLICGLVLLFGQAPLAHRIRVALDSALAASSAGVLLWYFSLAHLWQQSNLNSQAKVIDMLYPLGDIAALFIALILLLSWPRGTASYRSCQWIVAGICLWTLADGFHAYYYLRGTFVMGAWYQSAWPLGALCFAFAAMSVLASREESAIKFPAFAVEETTGVEETSSLVTHAARSLSQAHRLLPILWPYIVALAALAVVITHDYLSGGENRESIVAAGTAIFLLMLVRQIFTLVENDRLARSLHGHNESLEKVVEQRTQQLRALHDLTRAVTCTLDAEEVVAHALEHTRHALCADAAMIWLTNGDETTRAQPAGGDATAGSTPAGSVPRSSRVRRHLGLEGHSDVLETLNRYNPLLEPDTIPIVTGGQLAGQEGQPTRATLCLRAPLRWQNHHLGSIGVLRWESEWDHTETQLLESIGLEIGAALYNAQRYGEAVEAADRDAVTGLFNHRAISRLLDEALQHADAEHPLSVIMLDLNNFKWFNDTFGHPAGDAVLRRTAQLLATSCRQNDLCARYGGDEFVAILPAADAQAARRVAERLDERVRTEGFRRKGETEPIPMSITFGIATYPFDSANGNELIALADANLYAAKATKKEVSAPRDTGGAHFSTHTLEVLDAMITAINNNDRYTRRHSEDVTEYALLIAAEIGLSPETMRVLRVGALLHDVGKIGVPEEILKKPGQLSAQEFEAMKRHPQLGALICEGVPGLNNIVDIVRSHHERWDGGGYPDGLAGEETPILARLLAVADAFSAMTTSRPYRTGLDWSQALSEIEAGSGTQFDPQMARAFVRAARSKFE
jgi:diguanylate cyclase (GGDEF)-like protein/putative nucleotidyltransferase with HDIG domain